MDLIEIGVGGACWVQTLAQGRGALERLCPRSGAFGSVALRHCRPRLHFPLVGATWLRRVVEGERCVPRLSATSLNCWHSW